MEASIVQRIGDGSLCGPEQALGQRGTWEVRQLLPRMLGDLDAHCTAHLRALTQAAACVSCAWGRPGGGGGIPTLPGSSQQHKRPAASTHNASVFRGLPEPVCNASTADMVKPHCQVDTA
jgi:hypothetical protein